MGRINKIITAFTPATVLWFGAAVSANAPVASAASEVPADADLQAYVSGNGLLNRGLYDLAAKEYRKFLAAHPKHEKAPIARYGLAVSLFRLGNLREATEELGQLHELNDFEYAAEVATMFGQCHLAGGRFGEAVNAFERVLDKHGNHALADDAAAQLVEAQYRDHNLKQAVSDYERLLKRWAKSAHLDRGRYFAGLAEMKQESYASAAQRFAELLYQHVDSPFTPHAKLLLAQCHHNAGKLEKASGQYRRVLEDKDTPYRPDALLGLATILRQDGRAEAAGQLLDELLEKHAGSPLVTTATLVRGRAWFDLGDYGQASRAFRRVLQTKDPLAADAAYWAAKCKLRQGDHAAAAGDLKRAIKDYRDNKLLPEMVYDHAVALLRDGQSKQAASGFEDFRSRFPEHESAADALHLLATIAHQQQDYERSQKHVNAFLEQYPNHEKAPNIAYLAAENEYLSSDYKKAAAQYRQFLKTRPADEQAATARYRLGMTLYRLQEFDEALELLSETGKDGSEKPAFHPMHLALGDISFQRNDWKPAELHLSRYLSKGHAVPAADDALLKLGLALQRQDKYQEAVEHFDRLLDQFEKSPHRLQAIFERGQALVALKQYDDAAETFKTLLAEGGKSRFAVPAQRHLATISLHRSDFKDAAKRFGRVARDSKGTDEEAEALFQEGQALMSAKGFPKAEKTLGRLIKNFPEHERINAARAHLTIALARQDQYEPAIKSFEKVDPSKLNPAMQASLHYERAWCLRASGNEKEAAQAYRKLIAKHPQDLQVHALLELADIEADREHYQEAIGLLRQLREEVKTAPNKPDSSLLAQADYQLGTCLFQVKQYSEAADVLADFAERYPDSKLLVSASFFCGESLFELGQHQHSIKHFDRVAAGPKSDSAYGPSLLRLGECHATRQQWSQSEAAFAEYLKRFGSGEQWFQAEFGLGWARENQGQHEEAIKPYKRIVDRHQGPTAARAQFQIGQCLFAQQQYEAAVRELLKVDILYAYPEWSAAALYEAGRCFEKLMKTAEARQQYETVVEKHKDTQWAGMASRRLNDMTKPSLPGR